MASSDDVVAMASIAGVAGTGFRLSLMLNAICCEVASDGLEVHSIAKSLSLFSLTLKQAVSAFQAQDSVHSRNAVESVRSIGDDTSLIFDEFGDMLERAQARPTDGSPLASIQQRFKAGFKTHRVQYLLAQLEAHKLSLLLILKVLHLGKLMASTWRTHCHAEEQAHLDLITEERLETQNVLIVRYWQISKLSRLYEASRREGDGDRVTVCKEGDADPSKPNSRPNASHAVDGVAPLEYATIVVLAELRNYSLGELDKSLAKIRESPREMVRVSSDAIGPLLERWTIWEEVQQRGNRRRESGRHNAPFVDQMNDDEDERQYYERFRERGDSPRGVYLEGTTTDWRRPHSVAAMEEAKRRRQKYRSYQPSAHEVSSDEDGSADSTTSKRRKKKSARRHIIESGSSDSSMSESEDERRLERPQKARRNSGSDRNRLDPERLPTGPGYPVGTNQAIPRQPPPVSAPPSPHHIQPGAFLHRGYNIQPQMQQSRSNGLPNGSHPYQQQPQYLHPYHAGAPYPQSPVPSPHMTTAQARYTPPGAGYTRMPAPQRATSHEARGGGKYSPNHSPVQGPGPGPGPYHYPPYSLSTGAIRPEHSRPVSREKKKQQQQHQQRQQRQRQQGTKENLREGAAKGILGAGAIAGFLEALEALDI